MKTTNEISICEICGNEKLTSVLNLGKHPLCDDLILINEERVCQEYDIEILYCDKCMTAHQRFQVSKLELFPKTYHYRSRFTSDVLNGMRSLVESTQKRVGALKGKVVLDIGCNDGSLLDFFKNDDAITVGLEPTGAYLDGLQKGHDLYNDYLTLESAKAIHDKYTQIDIITFTNVFAHIEDLQSVLESLKILMNSKTIIVIENHYLGSILEGNQFDTFYHEHPRTYSLSSFLKIANNLNVKISGVEFPSRYGGNIRVFMNGFSSCIDDDLIRSVLENESTFHEKFLSLNIKIGNWKKTMQSKIADLVAIHGPLVAKAFPGRAAILIKLLDIDVGSICAVYEKEGSMKIGNYVPGTRIPILSDNDLVASKHFPEAIINLAWHIKPEVEKYLIDLGFSGDLINIVDANDF